jgi:hypothetical protein
MRTEEIERELRAMRSEPDPDFARRLDEWVAADFPPERGLGPRLRERARSAGPLRRAWDRLASTPPRRILMPVGVAATAAVVVGIVISNTGGESSNSGATVSSSAGSGSQSAAKPSQNFDQVAPNSSSAGGAAAVPELAPETGSGGVARGTDQRLVDATARLSLATEASKVQDVANQVVDVTDSHKGIVSDSQVTTDQGGARASFSLEIPYDQLDAALSDLSGLADVVSRTQSKTDITAKAVHAKRDLANTLEKIHKTRVALIAADSQQQRLILKSQLQSLEANADAYRTQFKSVERQARYATVDVEIASKHSESGGSGGWGIDDAFHDSGQVLETIAGISLVTLAVMLPLSLLALIGWAVATRTVKRRREAVLG